MSNHQDIAGKLNQRVTLQTMTRTADAIGGAVISWQNIAELWASIAPLNVRESLQQDKILSEAFYTVTMRYRADITSDKRLSYNGRILHIEGVTDRDHSKQVLVLRVREEVGQS
jgi:SPP1 family predicted phage head-tail adaptor